MFPFDLFKDIFNEWNEKGIPPRIYTIPWLLNHEHAHVNLCNRIIGKLKLICSLPVIMLVVYFMISYVET